MLTWFREKFGKIAVVGVVVLLSAVFVFYGIITPKGYSGGAAAAGTVNGDQIPLSEFNRAYNRQLQFFKKMLGSKVSDAQLKNFHIRESVFQQLVRRMVMIQQGKKEGYVPSNAAVRAQINQIPAFQTKGQFDFNRYKRVLQANGYTPAAFESMVRDDLTVEGWQDYFRDRVNVSENEIKQQFLATGDKRDIKYVLLTNDAGKKDVHVQPAEVKKYLANPTDLNLVRSQYEARKAHDFKGKSFDAVKGDIARDLIASSHLNQIAKANRAIADRIAKIMTASKASDKAVNQVLKRYDVQVRDTGWITREMEYIPGIGTAPALLKDAFASKSPIDPAQGGQVKVYPVNNWVLVAVVTKSQKPDLSKLTAAHDQIARQIIARKERTLFETWLSAATKKAKVVPNPAVLGGDES